MSSVDILVLLGTGVFAGLLGGLLGIGGSIVMIPALTLLLEKDYHLAQATAMIVNVFVAIPAVMRHGRSGSVRWDVVRMLLPFGLVAILIGVAVSNELPSLVLERFFGVFLIYIIGVNVRKLLTRRNIDEVAPDHVSWWRSGIVGSITCFFAGLLGIGGGIIAVPLLQRIASLPLRQCIGTSSALMCITAVFGATAKNLMLSRTMDGAVTPLDAGALALGLIPFAIVCSYLGAMLTHRLPLMWVRIVFIVLLSLACLKFLGVPITPRG